jgi:hypothetical protein
VNNKVKKEKLNVLKKMSKKYEMEKNKIENYVCIIIKIICMECEKTRKKDKKSRI